MSLTELKQEAERLTPEQRRHLTAHLVALERKSDPSFKQRLADKIDDKTPGHWVDIEQIRDL